ncbi:MAG: hypothetical protein N2506_06010 [Dehalococcoidales bacterium]|nr:hypothetical protein [Dehalococcoidales bacterium]
MGYAGGAAAGGAAYYAAVARAIKASGAIVSVEPEEFLKITEKTKDPLIVVAKGGIFKANYQYLTSYRGLAFHTKAPRPLNLPSGAEVIAAGEIWIPT